MQEADAREILDAWPAPARDPALWRDLETSHAALVGGGEVSWELRPQEPWFHVFLFVAALDHARLAHSTLGVPDDVSWATLRDLGRALHHRRRVFGRGGLGDTGGWLSLHFRGRLFRLGGLQFERQAVWFGGTPFERGVTPALGVHIPGDAGPLSPSACDESFAWAADFFARHFPETPYRAAVCMSWLLDPQLREYLPADSNIVRFQDRFTLNDDRRDGDGDVFRFVFRRPDVSPDDVPQRTTLERALVAHLRAGGRWYNRRGWLLLPD